MRWLPWYDTKISGFWSCWRFYFKEYNYRINFWFMNKDRANFWFINKSEVLQTVAKMIEITYIFTRKTAKIQKNCLNLPRISSPPDSIVYQACRNHSRQWRPEMSGQIWNQHWIKGEGVSQLLSLIFYKIEIFSKEFFEDPGKYFLKESGPSLRGDYIHMIIN